MATTAATTSTTTTKKAPSIGVDPSTPLAPPGLTSFPAAAPSSPTLCKVEASAKASSSKASASAIVSSPTSAITEPQTLPTSSDNFAPFVKQIFSIVPRDHQIPAPSPSVISISSLAPSVTLLASATSAESSSETKLKSLDGLLKQKSPSKPPTTRSKSNKRKRSEEDKVELSSIELKSINSRGILTRSRSQLKLPQQKDSVSTTGFPSSSFDITSPDGNSSDQLSTSSSTRLRSLSKASNRPSAGSSGKLSAGSSSKLSAGSSGKSSAGSSRKSTSSLKKTDETLAPPPKKKKCQENDVKPEEPSISEVIDLPCEEMTDRQKMNVISDYLSKHYCIFDKTLALSALHKLHARICRRFKRAITHVSLLNNRIRSTGTRYKAASDGNRRSARYVLRMRLAVLEGVRTCFCEYAQEKAEILKDIERVFVREHRNLTNRFGDLDDTLEVSLGGHTEDDEDDLEHDGTLEDTLGSQGDEEDGGENEIEGWEDGEDD